MLYASSWFRRPVLVLVGLCALGAAGAKEAAGQAPAMPRARLEGVVVDAVNGQPVESATVTLVGSGTAVTTLREGTFELEVAPGPVILHVTAPGHSSVLVDLQVGVDSAAPVRVLLPSFAVTLSELLVQTRVDPERPRDDMRTAADLVAEEVPRTRVNSGQVGKSDFDLNLRLATSFGGPQAPTVLIDGVVLSRGPEAFEALQRIPAAEVEEVQVLRGPSAAFLYPFAANGVILVKTKRGQGR
jgi:hypothetical protein